MIERFREHIKGKYAIYCTATYSNDMLPTFETTNSDTGVTYTNHYALTDDFRLMVKRIRKDNLFERPFSYWCTTEYGGRTHRPHFHYVIFVEKQPGDDSYTGQELALKWEKIFISQWKRRVGGTTFKPVYKPLSRFIRKPDGTGTYDVHLVTENYGKSEDISDVMFYISKYCLKFDKWVRTKKQAMYSTMIAEEYSEAWKKLRPRMLISKEFGISKDTRTFVTDCINFALKNGHVGPVYVNPDGKTFPLSPYYRKKFLTLEQKKIFLFRDPTLERNALGLVVDNTHMYPETNPADALQKAKEFERMCDRLAAFHNDIIID